MAEAQLEFKRRLREQAEKLFALARELEDMSSEASTQWSEAESNSEEETFWNGMRESLEDVVNGLDDAYNELDEVVDDEDSMPHRHEQLSDDDLEDFETVLDELEKEDK